MTKSIGMNRIPHPPQIPIFRNLFSFDRRAPIQALIELSGRYGEIFSLDLMGKLMIVVSSAKLADELCDQERFDKSLHGTLGNARRFVGDGLFTARTDETNWRKARHILLPSFSQNAMRDYHPMMVDIASQLILKWSRLNSEDEIDVARDMTALTLDTIGLCGFGYRFNSFYREHNHFFVQAMVDALDASMHTRGLPGEELIFHRRERRLKSDIRTMNSLVDQIIADRKEQNDEATSKSDLLSHMLSGVDKETGEKLDDVNIRYQIITFLIAGHETTSGLLSFVIYYLLKHPDVLEKCCEEVGRVLGNELTVPPTYEQINQLNYVSQALKETLRLSPTAPAFGVTSHEDTVLSGRYTINKGTHISLLLPLIHRDKAVWGERAEEFDPDNFTREAESIRPPNSYKPFGNGRRACVGQQFAMHEATLVLAMILQRFDLVSAAEYQLKIRETLTLKPEGLKIKVRQRAERVREWSSVPAVVRDVAKPLASTPANVVTHNTPMLVLYGSNMGTAEERARQIASDGADRGFATTVAALDDYVEQLPTEGPVLIVTASYHGNPPDNAVAFCKWLKKSASAADELYGVQYSVFGYGNRDWTATYQAIPRYIDERLANMGATRLHSRGEGDAKEDFDGQFRDWYAPLWEQLASSFSLELDQHEAAAQEPQYSVEIFADQPTTGLASPLIGTPMVIKVNRELRHPAHSQAPARSTRHVEIELPEAITYRAGDHFGVVPLNNETLVRRVSARFGFECDAIIRLNPTNSRHSFLPVGEWISVYRLLGEYTELQATATRKQIQLLAAYTQCPDSKFKLLALAGDDADNIDDYKAQVLIPHKSIIDLLDEFPACILPFNVYLELLAPLAPRYYSISSSPLFSPRSCSLTVTVLSAPARTGQGTYKGVCSNYLAQLIQGREVRGFVKDTGSNFRLPGDPSMPLIMICAGTGLAPFRGFLQERAALASRGQRLGRAMLFFGCQHPDQDFLYEDELREFEDRGIVELHTAFSRVEGEKKTYVQHQIMTDQDTVWAMIESGAKIYVCGDASGMAAGVKNAFTAIYRNQMGSDIPAAERWLTEMTTDHRYLVDVWAST